MIGDRSPVRAAPTRSTARAGRPLAAALLVAALGACNAVLGIEERELVEAEAALSCDTYCDAAMANCTDDFQQYESRAACVAMCEQLELGEEGDTTGNTVACRLRNAQLAAETGERGDHCPLAGPGGCGDRCANFCEIYVPACADLAASAASAEACLDFCRTSIDNAAWTPLDDFDRDKEASIQCRLWHLANATLAPDVHCGHSAGSTKCNLTSPDDATTTSSSGGGGGGGSGEGGGS